MGLAKPPKRVKLICGFISNDPDLIARSLQLLRDHAGPTDDVTERWPFDDTDYYTLEMGEGLQRQFAAFERLIDPVELASLKLLTNTFERRICEDLALPPERRRVNLDPGYVTMSKLVLATTKDFGHRVYFRDGIYAESTLCFRDGRWQAWPWTYPDYASGRYDAFLERSRQRLRAQLSAAVDPCDPPRESFS